MGLLKFYLLFNLCKLSELMVILEGIAAKWFLSLPSLGYGSCWTDCVLPMMESALVLDLFPPFLEIANFLEF